MSKKISVVIVTYNSKSFIDECLKPIVGSIGPDLEVIVWDNESPDGSLGYVRENYPSVLAFGENGNRGFAAGNNAAFRHCTGDYVLLLNPDAFLENAGQIAEMAAVLDRRADVCAVSPMLLNADGSHQVGDCGWRHSIANTIGHFLFLHHLFPDIRGIYLTNAKLFSRPSVEVDWLCGACMMVRKSTIDTVGGLDEEIFMYGEDVEWGERMRAAGAKLLYLPGIRVTHLQGATQKGEKGSYFISTKWLDALSDQIGRTQSGWQFTLFKGIAFAGMALRFLIYSTLDLVRGRKISARAKAMKAYACHALKLRRGQAVEFPGVRNRQ
ncbi:N-acetylglucosaminyl-diphospho-decaprenol L-rhamnosyltransferase [Hartmannibacter diazotrophicus]|uniref:N-acetylglucosaminyl-diphospho-decaprenol L-rhamnosyltransferase n=1 Tax=Hartmannibacter diazotrophicus TaxID=1482074 RepID=A0A2C9D3C1_9HYPH|nr:glycosyltransferase family 2 protein [Hartmannibacter diazotrophicus]SON54766.1 N-acetylglucosaminyl-diphospho-decaprenol L-rhamnosyltransferase [Hartmannibacter diazotrophicus]